jgi:hypothetical protein
MSDLWSEIAQRPSRGGGKRAVYLSLPLSGFLIQNMSYTATPEMHGSFIASLVIKQSPWSTVFAHSCGQITGVHHRFYCPLSFFILQ